MMVENNTNQNNNNNNNSGNNNNNSNNNQHQNINIGRRNTPSNATSTTPRTTSTLNKANNNSNDNIVDTQVLELKQALIHRSKIAVELTQCKLNRAPISRICKDIYEHIITSDEPFGSEHQNPWKKSAPTNLLQQNNARTVGNAKTYNEYKTELSSVIAFGLPGSKCDELLFSIKKSEKIPDIEKAHFQSYFVDLAVSVLRIILKYNIVNAIPFQNKSNSIENAHKILKVKDDTFNKRPLPANVFSELKSFWNDPAIVSTYCHHKESLLPKYLLEAINEFNICSRVFGGVRKQLEEAEILKLIHNPLENCLPEYALTDLRILDISSLKIENIENWILDFTDTKSFVWVCSLASFDSIEEQTPTKRLPQIKSTRILPRSKSVSNFKNKNSSGNNINNSGSMSPSLSGNNNGGGSGSSGNISIHNSGGSIPNFASGSGSSNQLVNSNSNTSLSSINDDSNVSVEQISETLSNNSLIRSVELFRYFTRFIKRPAILFFTDKQQFLDKIKKGVDFRQYFPEFKGNPKESSAIFEFIKQLFTPAGGVSGHTTVHTSTLNPIEDLKVISATIFAIVAQESIDILI